MFSRKGFKNAVMSALLGVVIAATGSSPLDAKTLKGGVEEQNLRLSPSGRALQGKSSDSGLRVARPPRALEGSAVDANAFAQTQTAKADSLDGGVVDDNAFAQPPKNFDIGAERGSKELVLAWEKWHHQLSEAIYTRWQRVARDAGKATLRVTITRDRRISAQIMRSNGGQAFDAVITEAIESLQNNPGLTFPEQSQRDHVSFEADYIAASHVKPGYSWVKNDYEKVNQSF